MCGWCHQCPRLTSVCCLFLSVVLPQPNLGTRAASPVSQAGATRMRMLRGGSCCRCSYFLPSNSLVVVEFGFLLTCHWRTALTLPLAKRALDSPGWPWRFPHGILVVLGPRSMQALAGFTDTTPVIQVRICTDLCGFHIPDTLSVKEFALQQGQNRFGAGCWILTAMQLVEGLEVWEGKLEILIFSSKY